MINQDTLNHISSYTSKLLRKNFGKGPQSCQTTLSSNLLTIYIKGFISPMEEALFQQGQKTQVDKARTNIINYVLNELRGAIEVTIGTDILESYHDWNFPNNTGLLLFILEDKVDTLKVDVAFSLKELESEVNRISELVEKVPERTNIFPISPNVCLVERVGILIPIEKALISRGFSEELKFTKDEMEKVHFHRSGIFEKIFKREVNDIFVDWNFKEDKSFMAFILR